MILIHPICSRHQPTDTKPRPPQYHPPPAPPPTDMLKFVRKPDAEAARLAAEQVGLKYYYLTSHVGRFYTCLYLFFVDGDSIPHAFYFVFVFDQHSIP